MMRTMLAGAAGLSLVVLSTAAAPAKAMMIAPAPISQRVATADCVVVGKVTRIEDKMVPAKQFAGDKREYQIAVLKVEDNILGVGGLTHIRVGFFPPPPPTPAPAVAPGGRVRPFFVRRRYPQFTLAKDQEALLFLTKAPRESFYVGTMYYNIINKKGNANFAKEVSEAKRYAKMLAEPMAGLESKNKEDRFLTAAMLLTRYRTPKGFVAGKPPATEPIDAKESKLILLAMADANWGPPRPGMFQMNPQAMFYRLGLKPGEAGWNQPKDFRQFPEAAKKWLKEHADTYRIQKFVEPKAETRGGK